MLAGFCCSGVRKAHNICRSTTGAIPKAFTKLFTPCCGPTFRRVFHCQLGTITTATPAHTHISSVRSSSVCFQALDGERHTYPSSTPVRHRSSCPVAWATQPPTPKNSQRRSEEHTSDL